MIQLARWKKWVGEVNPQLSLAGKVFHQRLHEKGLGWFFTRDCLMSCARHKQLDTLTKFNSSCETWAHPGSVIHAPHMCRKNCKSYNIAAIFHYIILSYGVELLLSVAIVCVCVRILLEHAQVLVVASTRLFQLQVHLAVSIRGYSQRKAGKKSELPSRPSKVRTPCIF